jgi:hypothetical protein
MKRSMNVIARAAAAITLVFLGLMFPFGSRLE